MRNLKIGQRALLSGAALVGAILAPILAAQAIAAAPKAPPAPKPPTASTGGTLQVTYASATLTGSVNPRGQATNYTFQYGITPGYGYQTQIAAAGNGTSQVKVNQTISGLQAGTIYYYRLVAINPTGTTEGKGHFFTTKSVPLKFVLSKTAGQVVYRRSFTISGILSGTANANRELVLQASSSPPQTGIPPSLANFAPIGSPVSTNAAGGFSFLVPGLSQTTRLRVATIISPGALRGTPAAKVTYSPVITEKVAVRVVAHVRSAGRPGYVRFYGTVAPSEVGARVVFQLLRSGGRTTTVGKTVVTRASRGVSRFSGLARIRKVGRYRAFVQVSNGPLVANHSRVIVIR